MPLSVIGAGLGRTGTMSLKLALERVGLGPCYHMKEVFAHLETHVPVWDQAADGKRVDWDALFDGYQSAVDHPTAVFYRELAEHYPAAKTVLTVRDPDRWFQSFSATILHPLTEPLPDRLVDWGKMHDKVVLDRVFDGNVADKTHMIASYERHNEGVKRTIPPERLLIYEVAQGWEPLCRFLGVPVPNEPFPISNTAEDFRTHLAPMFKRERSRQSASGMWHDG
jgi:hypothetical protein